MHQMPQCIMHDHDACKPIEWPGQLALRSMVENVDHHDGPSEEHVPKASESGGPLLKND